MKKMKTEYSLIPDLSITIFTKDNKVFFEISGFSDATEAEAYALLQHQTLNLPQKQDIPHTIH